MGGDNLTKPLDDQSMGKVDSRVALKAAVLDVCVSKAFETQGNVAGSKVGEGFKSNPWGA